MVSNHMLSPVGFAMFLLPQVPLSRQLDLGTRRLRANVLVISSNCRGHRQYQRE